MASEYDDSDDEFEDARENQDDQATPKALPSEPALAVPIFNLYEDQTHTTTLRKEVSTANISRNMAPPSLPRFNGTSPSQVKGSSLMPPPTVKPSLRPSPQVPQMGGGLRVPTTGPLPNRGAPSTPRGPQNIGPAPQANTAGKRNKVLLKPGHSPLDWATLTKSGNLAGVPSMQRVTPSMLKHNNGRKGKPAWSSYKGKVYHISPYLPFHPGGEGELMRAAGRDGEKAFMEIHPWVNWDNMLSSCLVGIMVSEGADEGLDGLD
ncbi:cytochrome b5-like heme/steroid binding domain-containing protein [Elsinoe ampelina]|uniref:Cytochrome b5-like heme/steroid binding domain-containing protein n=1 Tax=Elsinoe ampelina TaxID=302913 RepID=A0A6A6GFY1_9PEZI|nr:cytochrome b5-like heme/steroid binding domain-containing protein [Elsinoe ampelina]